MASDDRDNYPFGGKSSFLNWHIVLFVVKHAFDFLAAEDLVFVEDFLRNFEKYFLELHRHLT